MACLCYKHNIPIVDTKSCVVYDKLRDESIDLVRLNSFDNYKDIPDGHMHIARDLRLAKEKGILRPGLSYIYHAGKNDSRSARRLYILLKKHGLANRFSRGLARVHLGENTHFKILRELKDKPGLYQGVAGLRRLAKKYKIRPKGIWLCFDRNFREEMGWGKLRHGRLPGANGKAPDPGKILKAMTSAA